MREMVRTPALRVLRQAAGLSTKEVGEHIGVSPSAVVQWEAGSAVPRADHAVALYDLIRELSRPTSPLRQDTTTEPLRREAAGIAEKTAAREAA